MKMYYQCQFTRDNEHTVGWVESRAAKVGKLVQLTDMPEPRKLWKVVSVGHKMSGQELSEKQSSDRKQRQASDI